MCNVLSLLPLHPSLPPPYTNCFILTLTEISTQETMEERSKAIRGDIQILNLTRNTFSELKGNIFFSGKLVNLQRIYMSRGKTYSPNNGISFQILLPTSPFCSSFSCDFFPPSVFHQGTFLHACQLDEPSILSANSLQTLTFTDTLFFCLMSSHDPLHHSPSRHSLPFTIFFTMLHYILHYSALSLPHLLNSSLLLYLST